VKTRKQTADGILILPHLTYLHGFLKIAKPNLGDGKKTKSLKPKVRLGSPQTFQTLGKNPETATD
jgi:hypothetical protein